MPQSGTPEYRRFRYWMHYAEGSAMPPLLLRLVFDRVANGPMPFFARPIARAIAKGANSAFIGPQLKTNLDYMEAELEKADRFAGNTVSEAEIQRSFTLEAHSDRASQDERRPRQ